MKELLTAPCYILKITDDAAGATESTLGGVPYWPEGMDYPADKLFLAQINMKDIPDNTDFPEEGMLQFFIGISDTYGLFEEDFAVVFHKEIGTPAKVQPNPCEFTPIEKPGRILIGDGSKLLGYPCFTQYDPREYEEEKRKYDRLLLQLDSDEHICWGDIGIANFFINEQKLAEGDFSDVFYNWDCC